jgi:hypothetical protein
MSGFGNEDSSAAFGFGMTRANIAARCPLGLLETSFWPGCGSISLNTILWDRSENDRATTEVDLWLHEQVPGRQDYRFTEPSRRQFDEESIFTVFNDLPGCFR